MYTILKDLGQNDIISCDCLELVTSYHCSPLDKCRASALRRSASNFFASEKMKIGRFFHLDATT
jgi:hypothetical protein